MELHRELTHGEVELRRQDEHRQRSLEAETAVDEPYACGDGNERDAQGRRQLEHGAREERDAQRADRRPPVALADPVEDLGLRPATVERAQGRESADDVQEMRREQPERKPALACALLRLAADQPHEHGHERQREQHQPGRDRVDRDDEREHGHRNDDREHDLRQIAGEVGLEPVDALHCGRRDLAGLGAVERERLSPEPALYELEAELGQDRGRGAAAGHLEAPRQDAPPGERECEQDEVERDIGQRRARERLRHDSCDQDRLDEDEPRGQGTEDRVQHEQVAHRAGSAHEALIENAHDQPAGGPPVGGAKASGGWTSWPVIRARNT